MPKSQNCIPCSEPKCAAEKPHNSSSPSQTQHRAPQAWGVFLCFHEISLLLKIQTEPGSSSSSPWKKKNQNKLPKQDMSSVSLLPKSSQIWVPWKLGIPNPGFSFVFYQNSSVLHQKLFHGTPASKNHQAFHTIQQQQPKEKKKVSAMLRYFLIFKSPRCRTKRESTLPPPALC